MSTNGWVDEENVVYIYNEILLSLKKEILSYMTTWMRTLLSEISQPQDKHCMNPLIWGVSNSHSQNS